MGNAAGKLNGAMVCDGGGLAPTGIYAEEAQDYDVKIVQRLILSRQLAPFYAGADEPDPSESLPGAPNDGSCKAGDGTVRGGGNNDDDGWWSYNLMVAQALQPQRPTAETPDAAPSSRQQSSAASSSAALIDAAAAAAAPDSCPPSPGGAAQRRGGGAGHVRKGSGFFHRLRGSSSAAEPPPALAPRSQSSALPAVDSVRHERSLSEQPPAMAIRRCVECPICFLYYPQNTNYTRCCHKPICTECFVQIKRRITDACVAPTHCPYCVAPNLGVAYYYALGIAALRAGYMRHRPRLSSNLSHGSMAAESSAREPAVVMTDDIRPALLRELTAALQAKHREQLRSAENMALVAAATRRASERATDGGGLLLFPRPDHHRPAARMFGRGAGSASALRQTPPPPPPPQAVPEYMAYIAAMHAAGRVDLEEFLVQEAIRQSLAGQAPPAGEEGAAMQNSEPAAEADAAARMLGGLDIAASSGQHGGSEGEEVAGSAPLVLDDSELDAIANVTSRPRPPAAASDTITSPVLTAVATAASPDDLISFAAVDADALVIPQSPSSPPPPPPGRPRRRPPPPPPPPPLLSATHSKQEQQQQSRHGAAEEPSQPQPPLIHL